MSDKFDGQDKMALNTRGLHIERKVGMYGDCKTINAYHDLKDFGGASYDAVKKVWIVSLLDRNNVCADYFVEAAANDEASMQHIESLIRLFYSDKYAAPQKVAARHLMKGDRVGSGETIVNVATGLHTPRGKIEVTLEKDGRRRLAFWGVSTVISIRRAA
jgi:hypothetical protein